MSIPALNRELVNPVQGAIVEWEPEPFIATAIEATDLSLEIIANAAKVPVQAAAGSCAPSIPAPARNVIVDVGCAKVTSSVKTVKNNSIEATLSSQNWLVTRAVRWIRS